MFPMRFQWQPGPKQDLWDEEAISTAVPLDRWFYILQINFQ